MTQELADKLIKHYEDSVGAIRGMEWDTDVLTYLGDRCVDKGICHCAGFVFGENIYNDEWVNSIKPNRYYWTAPVGFNHSVEGIIASLQFRIDRLKTFQP